MLPLVLTLRVYSYNGTLLSSHLQRLGAGIGRKSKRPDFVRTLMMVVIYCANEHSLYGISTRSAPHLVLKFSDIRGLTRGLITS
eukprot:scaffold437733_cov18-Prasinocladus_malaysianus.AAC.1